MARELTEDEQKWIDDNFRMEWLAIEIDAYPPNRQHKAAKIIAAAIDRTKKESEERIREFEAMNAAMLKALRTLVPTIDYVGLSPTGQLVLVRRGAVLGAILVEREIADTLEDLYQLRTAVWNRRRIEGVTNEQG